MSRVPTGVVFDLWNTVVPFPDVLKREAFRVTASLLGMNEATFKPIWDATRTRRETRGFMQFLQSLREDLGAEWTDELLAAAASRRRAIHGRAFETCAADTCATLDALRAAGMKLALISNCSSDVREMLDESMLSDAFDAIVLSAEFGVMKPDPRIFREAVAQLGLRPEDCIYIGDGLDDELLGAERAGLTPVLLATHGADHWAGQRISAISDLMALIAEIGKRA